MILLPKLCWISTHRDTCSFQVIMHSNDFEKMGSGIKLNNVFAFFGGGSALSSAFHIFYTCFDDDNSWTDTCQLHFDTCHMYMHFLNHNVLQSTYKYSSINKYIVQDLSISTSTVKSTKKKKGAWPHAWYIHTYMHLIIHVICIHTCIHTYILTHTYITYMHIIIRVIYIHKYIQKDNN